MSEQSTDSAQASEQAYFETGGEAPIPEPVEESPAVEQSETEVQETAETKPQKTVPLAALHEERAKAKEMRAKLERLEEQTRIGNERLNQLFQATQQRQEPQLPDVDTDPVAHFKARQEMLDRQVQQQNQYIAQQQAERQHQAQYQQLQRFVMQEATEFAKETPDFGDAVQHMRNADMQALMALGHPDHVAAQMVQQHHDQLVIQLAQQNANIPERIYALAKARGYAPKSGELAPAQQRIATAQKGVAASKSLGAGGSTTNNLTLEALANLPADEFAEATKDPRVFRRLMGG